MRVRYRSSFGRYNTCLLEDLIGVPDIIDVRICSGLKDKEGRDICEGDIVKYNLDDDYIKENWTGEVIFDRGVFRIKELHFSILRDLNLNCLEIIR